MTGEESREVRTSSAWLEIHVRQAQERGAGGLDGMVATATRGRQEMHFGDGGAGLAGCVGELQGFSHVKKSGKMKP